MLRSRVSSCLLLNKGDLVKTVKFEKENYIGDPINAVRIFNEKKSDEIIILDITCSKLNCKPNFELIKNIAEEARMPVCYGGGVKSEDDAIKIFNYGIEKISINSLFYENKKIVNDIIRSVGSQSVVLTVDIKKNDNSYFVYNYIDNKVICEFNLSFVKKISDFGFGEIILNNIDRDGTMEGFDNNLINIFYDNSSLPFTALGGAGSQDDIVALANKYENIGISCGSLFVYKGPRRAVLINYVNPLKR